LGINPADAGGQVSLSDYHVRSHIVGEGRGKTQNPIPVGIRDPQISYCIDGESRSSCAISESLLQTGVGART